MATATACFTYRSCTQLSDNSVHVLRERVFVCVVRAHRTRTFAQTTSGWHIVETSKRKGASFRAFTLTNTQWRRWRERKKKSCDIQFFFFISQIELVAFYDSRCTIINEILSYPSGRCYCRCCRPSRRRYHHCRSSIFGKCIKRLHAMTILNGLGKGWNCVVRRKQCVQSKQRAAQWTLPR